MINGWLLDKKKTLSNHPQNFSKLKVDLLRENATKKKNALSLSWKERNNF
jgi:hypothetical protein